MPVDYSKYPADWHETSLRIRQERAGNRCEGSPAYPECRAKNGEPHPVTGSRVVLTVAHLNHDTQDSADENLLAMCQRCHLTYDARLHAEHARETRRNRKAIGDLFA